MNYGTTMASTLGFDEAVKKTRAVLAEQGFGVATEIVVGRGGDRILVQAPEAVAAG